jgi:hypothetical protein
MSSAKHHEAQAPWSGPAQRTFRPRSAFDLYDAFCDEARADYVPEGIEAGQAVVRYADAACDPPIIV